MTAPSQVRLLVEDAEFTASFRFYRDVLGLIPQSAEQESGPYGCFKSAADGTDVALLSRSVMAAGIGGPAAQRGAADDFVLVFRVPEVDAAYDAAVRAGAEAVSAPADQPSWGMRVAHLRAPEGTLIELCAY